MSDRKDLLQKITDLLNSDPNLYNYEADYNTSYQTLYIEPTDTIVVIATDTGGYKNEHTVYSIKAAEVEL